MFFKKTKLDKTPVDIAFTIYEEVFANLKNAKSNLSNKHHAGHPERVEHDFAEWEKSHLDLLSKKVDVEIFKETQVNNKRLADKIYWLNWTLGVFAVLNVLIEVYRFYK